MISKTLRSPFWIYKVIYIYKISKSDHFPKNHPVSKVIALITSSDGEKEEISYLPVRETPPTTRTEFFKSTPSLTGPDRAELETILEDFFRLGPHTHIEILIETQIQLPAPWVLLPFRVRQFPDFLNTIKECPEIVIKPSECTLPLIPWRYLLPGNTDFIEMDSLGVIGLEYLEELDEYLLETR